MKTFGPLFVAGLLGWISCGGGGDGASAGPIPLEPSDTLFVFVPGGTFTNSSGATVHVEGFSMMVHEVSNRLYAHAARSAGLEPPPDPGFSLMPGYFSRMPDHPVVNVSPREASMAAVSMNLRLPTRNEWEYAASLGLTGSIPDQFPWGRLAPGDLPEPPGNHLAREDWNQRDLDGFLHTAPAGSYPLSYAGFADMAGNVAEMVWDDSVWVLKGGSWAQGEDAMRIGWGRTFGHGDRCWYAGFRWVRPQG